MNAEVTQAHAGQAPDDDDISLFDVASFVLRRRFVIFVSAFLGALFGLVSALKMPLEYTATASFVTHEGDSGGLSGVSSLAQQFGFSLPRSGSGERSPQFYEDLLQSREILDGVVSLALAVVTDDGVTQVDLAEHFEIEATTAEERSALTRQRVLNVLLVNVSRETGVVRVSFTTDEPELSAAMVRRLLDLMSAFNHETRRSHASAERGFAEERLEQLRVELMAVEDSLKVFLAENRQFTNSPQLSFEHDRLQRTVGMRQALVTAMAQAYEQARIDEVRNTSLITVIDQPERPALPDRRGRRARAFLGLILGIMTGVGVALLTDFRERAKGNESAAFDRFQQVVRDTRSDLFGLRRSKRLTASAPHTDV